MTGSSTSYQFGPYRIDDREQLLYEGDAVVPLPPKAVLTLVVLLRHASQLVLKEELMREVWPDTFVEEGGLARNISVLRKALGGEGDESYIATVPKRGYRFVAPVRAAAPRATATAEATEDLPPPRPDPVAAPAPAKTSRRAVVFTLIGFALLAIAASLWRWGGRAPRPAPRAPSLAVLPFDNLGAAPGDQYLADGLTDALITELAKAPGLLVISRNAAFQYRGRPVDVRRVGADLDVTHVLEGSVQRSEGQLRVTAQLIDVANGYHLWAEKYDRPDTNVFAVQDDISARVRRALSLTLGRGRSGQALAATAPDAAAYDAYLRGRVETLGTETWWRGAIPQFERAVEMDPRFALAHAALGDAYAHRFFYEDPDRQWEQRARSEIEKALALDPDLAEGYLARGNLEWTWPNRFPHEPAVRDYQRALAINPSLADAHVALGRLYEHIGLLDEALVELGEALRIEPGHDEAILRVAVAHLWQLRPALALTELESGAEDRDRNGYLPAVALAQLGREAQARRLVDDILTRHPEDMRTRSFRAALLARGGDGAHAREEIALVSAAVRNERGYSSYHHAQYYVGAAYGLLGDKRQAVEWLRKAADEGFPCYPFYAGDSLLAPLRGDPGFEAFMTGLKARWEGYRASLAAGPRRS